MHALFARIRAIFRRGKLEAEMAEEMRQHIEARVQEKIADGMSPEDARYAAQREFGGVAQVQEQCRDTQRWIWLEQTAQDARFAVRSLRKQPGFALVTVLTLALGIGANTAMFTLTNALLLRTLPVPHPAELVLARKVPGDASFSYRSYERLRDRARSVAGLAVVQNYVTRRWIVAPNFGGAVPEPVQAQVVSGNFFSVLGVHAALGRTFTSDDDRAAQPQAVVVLSHGFWQRRFGADASVIGKTVQLDAAVVTIVGVMPEGFSGFYLGVEPDLWWPIQLFPQIEPIATAARSPLTTEGWEWLLVVGRLAPGLTREAATTEFDTLFHQELIDHAAQRTTPQTEKQRREFLAQKLVLDEGATGFTPVRQRFAKPLDILTVAVGLVLLIACANVAGLLLARGAARQREFAVRTALGAGRGRLVRQLVTEGLLLALAGGAVGLLFAHWGTAFLVTYLPPPATELNLAPDGRVLLFALAASIFTGVFFALLPAWRSSRVDLTTAMKQQSGQAVGARSRLNAALVVAQMALAVTLLGGAGLFIRTLRNLRASDFGFQRAHVMQFSLESARAFTPDERAGLNRRLLAALASFPEVQSASLAAGGLLSGESLGTRFTLDGYPAAPDEEMRALFTVVGPRFFATLGIPLLRGRDFTATEAAGAVDGRGRKVVISETLARRFFGETDPIGRTLHSGLNNTPAFEIIGVAKDVKYRSAREAIQPEYYLPYGDGGRNFGMTFYVRTPSKATALAANLRSIVQQIDPQLSVHGLRSLDEVVDETLLQERAIAQFGGCFSAFALTLASLGLYGLLSYGVTQRTREIGVRVALGARTADVLALVISQGLRLALLGAGLGWAGALGLTRFAEKLLYGVTPADPATFTGVVSLLVLVALVSAWLPARRAAKIDPMQALRCD